jgi:hypothetical protein
MADRPDARELLAVARAALIDAVLPAVPQAMHYDLQMIVSAMAMAERELVAGVPEDPQSSNGATLDLRIRDGEFDAPGPERDAVERRLREWIAARLAISNPKMLAEPGE